MTGFIFTKTIKHVLSAIQSSWGLQLEADIQIGQISSEG